MEKKMLIWTILCLIISGILCQKDIDMKEDVFTFASTPIESYARIFPDQNNIFKEISLCLRFKTSLNREFVLFSLATEWDFNSFLVEVKGNNQVSLSVSTDLRVTLKKPLSRDWTSTCVTWSSYTGNVNFWINGDLYERIGFQKGYTISGNHFITIGEEQDSYGGSFDKLQSFIGDIADINMWDKVLTNSEVMDFLYLDNIRGNVITWRALRFNITGDVTINTAPCLPI
ncbi:C-reactive protein-like [Rhinoderma darwinii]|uniref:C-reactive protein-like n=1 Tax=Rhinoderma darwinii TaxID=43563 RepID=UPI003F66F037